MWEAKLGGDEPTFEALGEREVVRYTTLVSAAVVCVAGMLTFGCVYARSRPRKPKPLSVPGVEFESAPLSKVTPEAEPAPEPPVAFHFGVVEKEGVLFMLPGDLESEPEPEPNLLPLEKKPTRVLRRKPAPQKPPKSS